jgi:8-oxo-dGDP phosphatase
MARKHGPWTIHRTDEQFRNDFISVSQDQATRPDGKAGQYATVTMKPGVAVLPIDGDGQAVLVRQFRYALGRASLEVPSGTIDGAEPPARTARELREELGIEAGDWVDLGLCDMDTSIVRCPVRLFLAHDLSFTETEREGTETIETVRLPFASAVEQVMASAITHAPSCTLILKARMYLEGGRRHG